MRHAVTKHTLYQLTRRTWEHRLLFPPDADRCRSLFPLENDPLWYKDAIIYELMCARFSTAGDGMGDFGGLTQKLDYLQDLGVTAIWLLPVLSVPVARRRLRHLPTTPTSTRPTARCAISRAF